MAPPINIDGSTVNTITIDGTQVTKVTVDGSNVFSINPDSVVSRPDDNNAFTVSDRKGLKFDTSESWSSIQGEISSQTQSASTAYLTETDGTVISSVNISSLSSGDVFTFNNVGLSAGQYEMLIDAGGSRYTIGNLDAPSFPYADSDGDLTIEAGVFKSSGSTTSNFAYNISRLGNINL